MEIHGFCVDIHGDPSLHGDPWRSIDYLWMSIEIHQLVDFHGDPSLHGHPWRSMVSLWTSMEIHRLVDVHGSPSILCGTLWRSITSWASMEIHGFCVDFHGDPSILCGTLWSSITSWASMEIYVAMICTVLVPSSSMLLHLCLGHYRSWKWSAYGCAMEQSLCSNVVLCTAMRFVVINNSYDTSLCSLLSCLLTLFSSTIIALSLLPHQRRVGKNRLQSLIVLLRFYLP